MNGQGLIGAMEKGKQPFPILFRTVSCPKRVLCLFLMFVGSFSPIFTTLAEPDDFDEILIYVHLPKYGGAEIPAAIKGKEVYLSLADMFDFLHIKYDADENLIEGFLLHQKDRYVIDGEKGHIQYKEQVYDLSADDFILQEGFFYLRGSLYGEIFGLECTFDFRSLSVGIKTRLDLPVFRIRRQEMFRKNLQQLHHRLDPDTVLGVERSWGQLSMLDWGIIHSQNSRDSETGRVHIKNTRINLDLGGELALGEFNARLNLISGSPLSRRNQYLQWRHVNNDQALVKQVHIGRIPSSTISTLLHPVWGIQMTNISTKLRKSFGSYRISDHTEPEWMVELYVNNLLVDYVQADASGLYTFDIPLIYGQTMVRLRFYGPYGEEYTEEKQISIPFNFLPEGEAAYTSSIGLVDDGQGSVLSKGIVHYGLSNRVTIGSGIEYLSSLSGQNPMPYVETSIRLTDELLFSGNYVPGVMGSAQMNLRLPSNLLLEANYERLQPGQKAIIYNYLENRKLSLSMPLKNRNFSLFSRFAFEQQVYAHSKVTQLQLLLSGRLFGVQNSLSTFGNLRSGPPQVRSILSQFYRLPGNISFQPQVQFNYQKGRFTQLIAKFEKRVWGSGYLHAFYQNTPLTNNFSIGLGCRIDLSFVHSGSQFIQQRESTGFTQSLRGSIMRDVSTGSLDFSNRVNVGKSALTVLAFLDLNANQKRDEGEPLVEGLQLKVRGRQVTHNRKQKAIQVTQLQPYEEYYLELDEDSFDQISWRIPHPTIKIVTDPNRYKLIEVPIQVMGEAAGMVYHESDGQGMGRVTMNFYRESGQLVKSVLTERDGYFQHMGLAPGKYKVSPDSTQLQKLGLSYRTDADSFSIEVGEEGDYVDGLDFWLTDAAVDSITPVKGTSASAERFTLQHTNPELLRKLEGKSLEEQRVLVAASSALSVQENTLKINTGTVTSSTDKHNKEEKHEIISALDSTLYYIQVMAIRDQADPGLAMDKLGSIQVIFQNGWYKYIYGGYSHWSTAIERLQAIRKEGFADAFLLFPTKVKEAIDGETPVTLTEREYVVQLLARKKRFSLDHAYFKGVSGIVETYEDGLYKYHVPSGRHPDAAIALQKELVDLGFEDAFIHYSLKENIPNIPDIDHYKDPDTHFRIQILVSDKQLELDDPVFKGIKGIDYYIHDGLYKYTFGVALNPYEARVLLQQVKGLGFEDAFAVPFYKSRRLK